MFESLQKGARMRLLKTSIAIVGVTLLVAACNKTETSNESTENTVVTENSVTTENAATENGAMENVATENVATDNSDVAPANATGNGSKDDNGPRH